MTGGSRNTLFYFLQRVYHACLINSTKCVQMCSNFYGPLTGNDSFIKLRKLVCRKKVLRKTHPPPPPHRNKSIKLCRLPFIVVPCPLKVGSRGCILQNEAVPYKNTLQPSSSCVAHPGDGRTSRLSGGGIRLDFRGDCREKPGKCSDE